MGTPISDLLLEGDHLYALRPPILNVIDAAQSLALVAQINTPGINGAPIRRVRLTGGKLRIPGGRLEILDTQTIEGGTVELLGSFAWSYLVIPAQQTLTLSATTVVRGGPGWIQGEGTLRNLGTLRADVEGQAFRVWPAVYVNEGTAVAVGGGILETR